MRTGRLVALALPIVVLTAVPSAARAQRGERAWIGIGGQLARPVGEFRQFVAWGGGLDLYGLLNVDRDRKVGLRLDGSIVWYGHESFETPLSRTVNRVVVDVDTDNIIFSLGVGPQITLGRGRVRPYVYGTVGFSYFATISSVRGTASGDFASSTNFDDVTGALTAGAGILMRVSRGRHPVSLDLSLQSMHNGVAEYLTRGDVVDNPDGSITVFPVRSNANLVTFRAGVAIGL